MEARLYARCVLDMIPNIFHFLAISKPYNRKNPQVELGFFMEKKMNFYILKLSKMESSKTRCRVSRFRDTTAQEAPYGQGDYSL